MFFLPNMMNITCSTIDQYLWQYTQVDFFKIRWKSNDKYTFY